MHLLHIFYMEKTIATYYKYFRNAEPDYDFRDTIEEIYEWFFDKLLERETYLRKVGSVLPIDLSEMPGQELGFKPIENVEIGSAVYTCYFSRKHTRKEEDVKSGGHLSEKVKADLCLPPNAQYLCYQKTWRSHGLYDLCPIAYNRDFGSIYYAPIFEWVKKLSNTEKPWEAFDSLSSIHILKIDGNMCYLCDAKYGQPYSSRLYRHIAEKVPGSFDDSYPGRSCASQHDQISTDLRVMPMVPHFYDSGLWCPLNIIEDMYGFKNDLLWDIIHDSVSLFRTREITVLIAYAEKSLGKIFQSVIQTYPDCKWFAPLMLACAEKIPFYDGATTLQQLLGVDKPTLRQILAEPTHNKFIFWLLMRSYRECSYASAMKTYESIMKKDKELMVNSKSFTDILGRVYDANYGNTKITTPHRAQLFIADMPMAWVFYVYHKLFQNYSISYYYKWLLDECYRFVETGAYDRDTFIMGEIFRTLRDYNNMTKEMNKDVAWILPSNLIRAHNDMVINYNEHLSIHKNKNSILSSIKALVPLYRGKRGNILDDDTYTMTQPMSIDDIFNEGIRLHHCVGSYYQDVLDAKGSMLLYFMRLKKDAEQPLVTVQINQKDDGAYFITEAAGIDNRPITDAEKDFLNRWIVAFNANVARMPRKKISQEQCLDDFAVWCQWGDLPTNELYKYIEEHEKMGWDKLMIDIIVAFSYKLKYCPKAGLVKENSNENICSMMIASMYGLCSQQTMNYTTFKGACEK